MKRLHLYLTPLSSTTPGQRKTQLLLLYYLIAAWEIRRAVWVQAWHLYWCKYWKDSTCSKSIFGPLNKVEGSPNRANFPIIKSNYGRGAHPTPLLLTPVRRKIMATKFCIFIISNFLLGFADKIHLCSFKLYRVWMGEMEDMGIGWEGPRLLKLEVEQFWANPYSDHNSLTATTQMVSGSFLAYLNY